jgi:hypothetical protein
MQGVSRGDTRATSAGSAITGKMRRWRPLACATAAVTAAGLSAGLSAVFATAATAAGSDAPPAANVAPGAYIGSAGNLNVVYTGTDGGVWEKQVGSASFATSLGGRLISAPSPILPGSTRIVFGEGTDHALWVKTGGGAWTSLGGNITSKPGAAGSNASTYRVYARGVDGAVWARKHTSSGWSDWYSVGGQVLAGTGPSAAVGPSTDRLSASNGSFNVLVAGTNHGLFLATDGVTGFSSAGGATNASPALVYDSNSSSLEGFAQGTTGAGYCARLAPKPSPTWKSMGGVLTSGMGATAPPTKADAAQAAASPSSAPTSSPSPSATMRIASWAAFGLGTDSQVWGQSGTDNTPSGTWTRVTP